MTSNHQLYLNEEWRNLIASAMNTLLVCYRRDKASGELTVDKKKELVTLKVYLSDLNNSKKDFDSFWKAIPFLADSGEPLEPNGDAWEDATAISNEDESYTGDTVALTVKVPINFEDFHKSIWEKYVIGKAARDFPTEHSKSPQTIFYLTRQGDLWRQPKSKYLYTLRDEKGCLKLLRYFINQSNKTHDYVLTSNVAAENRMAEQSTRTTIGKLNRTARNRLAINEETMGKLIDSRQASGYRLNPTITIQEVDD